MRIDAVIVAGFGALDGVVAEGLGDAALVVVLGPNEAGKSTLVDAIETALYGFEPARLDAHPRAAGAEMRVHAVMRVNGRRLEIDRSLGARASGRVTVGGVTRDLGNEPLDHVGAVPRALWRRLHRVSVDEAADAAGWHRAEARLLGGGSRGVRSPLEVAAELEREARSLWREDRRGRPRARVLDDELRGLRARRDAVIARNGAAARDLEESRGRARVARVTLARLRRTLRDDLAETSVAVEAAARRCRRARAALDEEAAPLLAPSRRLAERVLGSVELPAPFVVPAALWMAAIAPALAGPLGASLAALATAALLVGATAARTRYRRDVDCVLRRVGLARRVAPVRLRAAWPGVVAAAREVMRADGDVGTARRRRRDRVAAMRDVLAGARAALAAERAHLSAARAAVGESTSIADVDGEIAAVSAEIEESRRERDRLMLTAAVLREADARLRSRVRPAIVEAASRRLAAITGDARRLTVEETPEGPRLWMHSPAGAALPLDRASRGTREQALLALRLALIERAEEGAPLPVVVDDALAAWDPARRRAAAAMLARAAIGRQVILLTPQPEVAAALGGLAAARVVELDRVATSRAP